ncbi:Phenylalanine--tRNA ligase beta subunit [Varanus komodoensis]|nr:Phenylalanine--tRNA ligase beta subunit [Varanus komodoensis]
MLFSIYLIPGTRLCTADLAGVQADKVLCQPLEQNMHFKLPEQNTHFQSTVFQIKVSSTSAQLIWQQRSSASHNTMVLQEEASILQLPCSQNLMRLPGSVVKQKQYTGRPRHLKSHTIHHSRDREAVSKPFGEIHNKPLALLVELVEASTRYSCSAKCPSGTAEWLALPVAAATLLYFEEALDLTCKEKEMGREEDTPPDFEPDPLWGSDPIQNRQTLFFQEDELLTDSNSILSAQSLSLFALIQIAGFFPILPPLFYVASLPGKIQSSQSFGSGLNPKFAMNNQISGRIWV